MASFPSNREVIENLTEDLEKTCMITKDNENVATNESSAYAPENDTTTSSSESSENIHDSIAPDTEGSEKQSDVPKENVNEVELIDEASLLDRDSLLNDTEKENFKEEALLRKTKGNSQFNNGEFYESVISYSEALQICPLIYTTDRSILFANRAASKHKLDRKESAIQDCSKAIELNSCYIKAYLRRATLYEETEKLDEALEDYKKILELDPRNKEALAASMRLPQQINERNEKLKEEMFDKLKDLGNMVLRPFGLSTNNFKMTKDPSSGGYSINFVQNQ